MKIQRLTYLSLGSNQGRKLNNLQEAIFEIAESIGAIHKISSVYKTIRGVLKEMIFIIYVLQYQPIYLQKNCLKIY